MQEINCTLPSGKRLTFGIFNHYTDWAPAGAVYMFCRLNGVGNWEPLYIGQTESMRDRMPKHSQWAPAVTLGASKVLAMAISSEAQRLLVEEELIKHFAPVLNTQLMPPSRNAFGIRR